MNKLGLLYDIVDESTRVELEKKGEKSVSLTDVRGFLNSNKGKDVEFDIATLGGDLDTGIKIHELISLHDGNTTANIIGLTASAGTVIALACNKIRMSDNSLWLIHNGWKSVTGNIYDFKKAVIDMSKTDAIMVKIYKQNSNIQEQEIIGLMKAADWLTPRESEGYGFIDEVFESGVKIAASVSDKIKSKLDNNLLLKLEKKMNLFGKKEDKSKAYSLKLKDGNILAMSAEVAGEGVEVVSLGEMILEDGEYELSDGRKIIVAGGVITEVKEEDVAAKNEDEIVSTVANMLTASEAKIETMIDAKLKPLQAMVSKHEPPKGVGVSNPGQSSVSDDMQTKIEAKKHELKVEADKKRKE